MTHFNIRTTTDRAYLLHDVGIRNAISKGWIRGSFPDSNIQPASLDVRNLKVRVYDDDVRQKIHSMIPDFANPKDALMFFENDFDDVVTDVAPKIYEGFLDQKIPIPPGAMAEIFVDLESYDEHIFSTSVDLRSSRGRIHLDLASKTFQKDPEGYLYLPVNNLSFKTINLYGQDKFAQVFFHPFDKNYSCGEIVDNPEDAMELAKLVFKSMPRMLGSYVIFDAAEKLNKFRNELEFIDTKVKQSKEELYEELDLVNGAYLKYGDATIVTLDPEMKLPGNIGIQILHDVPYYQTHGLTGIDSNILNLPHTSCKAGWVDPGYEGRVTAHPTIKRNMILKKGYPLAFGRFFKYYTNVDRTYGSKDLGSHYQGSDGSTSKS